MTKILFLCAMLASFSVVGVWPAQGASLHKKMAVKVAKKSQMVLPSEFISRRAQKIVSELMSRPVRPAGPPNYSIEISALAAKSSWLQAVYAKNMVEASWATEMLSDKRLLDEVLERELGAKARQYLPKTLGLREFLAKKNFVNGRGEITADADTIDEALHDEFPAGFLVRPAVGIAPKETGKGLYADSDQFIIDLLKPVNSLYQPQHLRQPVSSHILDAVASGEAVVLQENFVLASHARHPLKVRSFQEVRVHTYENRVVEGAVPQHWVAANVLTADQVRRAENYVEGFLQSLPINFLTKQAWAIDVAVMDNGEMRVNDVITNRGQLVAWSNYLDQPRVIGAYTRHFEKYYGVYFSGWNGTLIRHNFANYVPYWEKRIEKARPGWKKALAYLPPVP
jgi:hypothetical protein